MRRVLLCAATFALFPVANCQPTPKANDKVAVLEKQVADLRQQINMMEETISGIVDHIPFYNQPDIDVSQNGFVRIDSENGIFYVQVHDVEPYLDGVKVHLWVGNPALASYDGFTVRLRWRSRNDRTMDFYSKTHLVVQAFPSSIVAGMWSPIDLVIPGVTPSAIGFVQVSIDAPVVNLPKKQ